MTSCPVHPDSSLTTFNSAGWLLRRAASASAVAFRLRLGGDALCSHVHTDPATGRTVFLRYRLKLQRLSRQQQQGSQVTAVELRLHAQKLSEASQSNLLAQTQGTQWPRAAGSSCSS